MLREGGTLIMQAIVRADLKLAKKQYMFALALCQIPFKARASQMGRSEHGAKSQEV
jgi:hypothetical protein